MKITRMVMVAAFCASPVLAQDWQPMSGDEITAALTDQVLTYEDATQKFFASGRTLYDSSLPSWGSWAVRGDQYCSLWPPSDTWDCYNMARAGQVVQFLDSYGNVSEGRFVE